MNQRSSEITDNYFEGNVSRIKVSDSGLWLKQINANKSETLLSAATISADNKKFRDVSIFEFDNSDNFVQRIDAEIGTLKQGYWQFKNVIVNKPDMLPEKIDKFKMRTKLTLLQIQESFSEPESLSFWQLPKFVKILEESGFSALRHKLHFHTILTTPILLVAMVLIASVFSIRFSRQNRNSILISGAVFTGFVFYFIAKLIASFGLAGNMPIIMAAWTPAIIFILIGIWAQLNLEDS
jgi:lipopolysaccharide export system permease protein